MSKQNGLIGPKGHFLLGHLMEFRKDPLGFLIHCSQGYGDVVKLRLLHIPVYLLLNPDDIEHVIVTRHRNFVKSRMYKLGSTLLGQGLPMSEGDFWLRQRRLSQPAFHRERIDGYGQIMVDHAERMLSDWKDGQVLDIHRTLLHLSVGIATKTLFNCELDDASEGISGACEDALKGIAARFSNPILPERVPTPSNVRYLGAVQRLNNIVYRIIQERRAKAEDTGDLLSMLLQARDEDGNGMTDLQLRDETLALLLGGFETTATALSWGWYLLAQHPQVEAKMLEEFRTVLGGRSPTVADLPKLPYTEMVLLETLRLYPPGPLMGREVLKGFEMGGHYFPAGAELWVVPWIMHRNSRYYEAPDEFRPERWEGDLVKRLPKFAYFPFSHGPRQCIGNAFASIEARLILATVVQKFHLGLTPGQVVETELAFTLRPKYGIKMSLTERSSSP